VTAPRCAGVGKKKQELHMDPFFHKALSFDVLGACFAVHNALGPGLLESAYEGALTVELANRGLAFERQVVYPLHYHGELCGAYIADLVVEKKIIVELKSVKLLTSVMEAQVINYLRLTGLTVGYLVNFNGERLDWRRLINMPP
jgi:GxxExxY protein